MQFNSILFASILAALASAVPAVDPLTVTKLTPSQSSAYVAAESSYLAALTTDAAFSSLVLEIATDTTALDAFTSAAGALATIKPTGSSAIAAAKSLIDKLPSQAASFYNSVLSADISIASSVVNHGNAAATSAAGAISSAASSAGAAASSAGAAASSAGAAASSAVSSAASTVSTGSSTSARGTASAASTTSGSGAAPTSIAKAGGVILAVMGAAVAML